MILLGDTRLPPRFWAKVSVGPDGCWRWTATKYPSGYGAFSVTRPRRMAGAHRVAYEALVGAVAEGLELDHLCRVRECVNPAHLEPVTRSENIRRGLVPIVNAAIQLAKTHCPAGHEYAGANLGIKPNGSRRCRQCHAARERSRRANAARAG